MLSVSELCFDEGLKVGLRYTHVVIGISQNLLKALIKWEKGYLRTWGGPKGFSAWDIQTGPFAALQANFVLKFYQLFNFHTGEPILITPERERERERGGLKKGKWHSHNLGETQDYECLGHSNRTICSPLSLFCSLIFFTFQLLYWGANSYYPRERRAENGKMEFS